MARLERMKKNFEMQSKYEKTLVIFLVFFALLSLILFLIVLCNGNNTENICTSPSCISAANHILRTVDSTLDPCEDFYKFACGNLFKNSFYRTQPTILHELKELKNHQVQQLVVMEVLDEEELPKSNRYLRKFYQLCYNTTAIEEDKDKTFLESLDRVIGGWPLSNGYSMPFNWSEVMLRAKHEGMKADFFLNIDSRSSHNDSKSYIEISPARNYDKNDWNEDKVAHFVAIASLWGRVVPGARAEMLKTMEFAKRLDRISEKSINATKNVTLDHQKLTISELQKSVQHVSIDWLDFLKNFTGIQNITQQTIVIVDITQEYFNDLQYLMLQTESKWRTNYIAALLILDEYQYLSKEVRNIAKKIRVPSKPQNRMQFCVDNAIDNFQRVIDGVYVRKIITPNEREDILSMLERVKDRLEIAVHETAWIDQESKQALMQSLGNMSVAIGWMYNDEEQFEKRLGYEKWHLNFDKPIVSVYHEINKYKYGERYENIGNDKDRLLSEMHTFLLDVNGYYVKLGNLLFLTAPLLQSPIYSKDRPKYMNYGSLGGLIGHELTHAVTHTHAQDIDIKSYSSENYEQIWTNQTKENFENASKCIVDEYNNYDFSTSVFGDVSENYQYFSTIDQENCQSRFDKGMTDLWYLLEGNETLEENLADFTGINLAYEAYQSWVYKHGQEQMLPGVRFTPNQLFWLMSTTYVCLDEKLLSERACKDIKHGESSFRANGPIRNSPYFARDFGCPVGSKMNPREKCRVYL